MSDWDEFETAEDKVPRDRWRRPLIVPPGAKPNAKPQPYTRVTTFADSVEDMYGLGQWQQRMVALGLAKRPDLLLSVSAHEDDKDELNRIAEAAKEAAAASAAATTGTALHKLAERYDRGQIALTDVPESNRADLAAYVAAMAPLTIHGIEEFVVIDEIEVAGTFDRIVEHDGRRYVADIKTGSIEYGAGKMAIQLALYARGELYTPGRGDRGATGVDHNAGLIVHLPAGAGTCQLYWIDLKAGWTAAKLCSDVRTWRKRKNLMAAASFGAAVLETPVAEAPQHAGVNGACPDYDSRLDPCPPGCASGTCVAASQAVAVLTEAGLDPQPIGDPVADQLNHFIAEALNEEALTALWRDNQDLWTAEHTRLAAARKKHLHQRVLREVVGA